VWGERANGHAGCLACWGGTARGRAPGRARSLGGPSRCAQYGCDLDAHTPKDWTPLSYAKAKGKYGVTHEKGIYPEDVLKVRLLLLRGAQCALGRLPEGVTTHLPPPSSVLRRFQVRHRPPVPGQPQARAVSLALRAPARAEAACSPRESYNPEAENFKRDRGSYQQEMEHPVRARRRVRAAQAPAHPPLRGSERTHASTGAAR